MYRHNQRQLEFEDFYLPFGGKLRSDNRWVKMAKFIPWDAFEKAYRKSFKNTRLGPPAKSVRVALGALIIKERLGTSDEETVEQIRENPYLQYFLGFKEYVDERPFDPSLFVYFRKRFGKKRMAKINETIACKALDEEAGKPNRMTKTMTIRERAQPATGASFWWMPPARRRTSRFRPT